MIRMAGIDYRSAGVAVRERFSLTTAGTARALVEIYGAAGVQGCVLLSTCNRTELYLSTSEETDPAALLCGALGLSLEGYGRHFVRREGRAAMTHLMMVAAGLRSQIRGEDQILAQVKAAAETARAEGCADPELATLFRCAVSAGKKARTAAPLSPVESSVARRALEVLDRETGGLSGRRALVIGNGEMGRLMAGYLLEAGCQVTMTLRSYKRGMAVIPDGCQSVPYEQRYGAMSGVDILVGATTSPHFTVQAGEMGRLTAPPRWLVDLAVPRDIEPEAALLTGARCWNVDDLGGNAPGEENTRRLLETRAVIGEYLERFDKWQNFRMRIPAGKAGGRG